MPTDDERAEQDRTAAVRTVVAYRDHYGIAGTDPLGPRPQQGSAGEDHDRAAAALVRMRNAASPARATDLERMRQATEEPIRVPAPAGSQQRQEHESAPAAAERLRQRAAQRGNESPQEETAPTAAQERLTRAREVLRSRRRRQQQGGDDQPPQQQGPTRRGPQL